jgi:hypothetical protein
LTPLQQGVRVAISSGEDGVKAFRAFSSSHGFSEFGKFAYAFLGLK